MKTPAKRDDFEMRINEVVHKPTGARFRSVPGSEEPDCLTWGRIDEALESGADYDRDDIIRFAKELLAKQK